MAAFGSDRVLIGASGEWPGGGAAYLFHTNGTLLMTFTNPAPSIDDYFGRSIAAVTTDRVLVGSPAHGANAEEVYLCNTNGTLLLTITNPAPAAGDGSGYRIAVLGSDRVVIGAPLDDTTGPGSGSVYVFSVDGTLLTTLNNPTPATGDWFGYRLAAFGNEGVIIGAPFDDTGATDAGTVYLFSVPSQPTAPSLTIQRIAPNTVVVSWPSPSTGFVLQQNADMTATNWTTPSETVTDNGTVKSIIASPAPYGRLYRLFKP